MPGAGGAVQPAELDTTSLQAHEPLWGKELLNRS